MNLESYQSASWRNQHAEISPTGGRKKVRESSDDPPLIAWGWGCLREPAARARFCFLNLNRQRPANIPASRITCCLLNAFLVGQQVTKPQLADEEFVSALL